MTLDMENVRCAPPEFGEGIQQFLVERSHAAEEGRRARLASGVLPIVVWVYQPELNSHGKCDCELVFAVTPKSAIWARSLADLPAANFQPVLCACHGRLIE